MVTGDRLTVIRVNDIGLFIDTAAEMEGVEQMLGTTKWGEPSYVT